MNLDKVRNQIKGETSNKVKMLGFKINTPLPETTADES